MKLGVLTILVLCFTNAVGTVIEISVDHGGTWTTFSEPLDNPPLSAMLRVRGGSPMVTVPSCALGGPLLIQVWHDTNGGRPLGMRWKSKLCNPTASMDTDGVVIENIVPKTQRPDWNPYVHDVKERQHQEQQQQPQQNLEPEKRRWWRRYSLYIMLFFVVALGQGIRHGLAEERMEIEREQEEKQRKNRSGSGQMRVLVPKRKESKARKRSTRNGTSTSSS